MLGFSRQSLIRRIIEIAQKPHGGGTAERAKQLQSILLPVHDPWVVESTVKFVTSPCLRWQERYIQHSVEGTCAALAQDSTHPACIKSFCQHVSEEQHPKVVNLQCYYHLLPAIAKHRTLHFWGRKLLDEMLMRQLAPSPEVEHSLLELYSDADNVVDLARVIEGMMQAGHTPSRLFYREALRLSMKAESDSTVKQVIACMVTDWGKKETERSIYLAALQTAQRESEVENIWDSVKTSGMQMDEESSHYLIEACLRVTANLIRRGRISYAMRCLEELASQKAPLSVATFDSLLVACIETGQLKIAVRIFKGMTRVYGFAPTRKGYSSLIKILSTTHSFYKNPVMFQTALKLCNRILGDTVTAYAGDPPLWVYTETAKPLTQLLGVPGYQRMYELSIAAAKGSSRSLAIESENTSVEDGGYSHWDMAAYKALLEACQISTKEKATLGLYFFGELLKQGLQPDEETFSLVLSLVHNRHDIHNDHFIHLISYMSILSADKIRSLQEPLLAALCRIYTKDHDRSNNVDGILLAATKGMLHSVLSSSHHHCIEQIDKACPDVSDSSVDCEDHGSDRDDTAVPLAQCRGLA